MPCLPCHPPTPHSPSSNCFSICLLILYASSFPLTFITPPSYLLLLPSFRLPSSSLIHSSSLLHPSFLLLSSSLLSFSPFFPTSPPSPPPFPPFAYFCPFYRLISYLLTRAALRDGRQGDPACLLSGCINHPLCLLPSSLPPLPFILPPLPLILPSSLLFHPLSFTLNLPPPLSTLCRLSSCCCFSILLL